MRSAVTFLAALFLTGAILIAWGVSAVANWYFGASLGSTETFNAIFFATTTSELFSWASLSSDILKAFSLFLVFGAVANKQFKEAAALGVIWAICTIWSFNSAAGFVALNHATVVDNRGHSATNWDQLDKEIRRLEERRSWIPEHRPVDTVGADLAGKETAYLYARTSGCTNVTAKGSREFCDQVSGLRREHANATAAADLDKQLADRRQEQKGTLKISSADPYAEMLAGVMGVNASQASTARAIYFASMAELISALGLWAVWSISFWSRRDPATAAKVTESATLAAAPVPAVLDRYTAYDPQSGMWTHIKRTDLERKPPLNSPEIPDGSPPSPPGTSAPPPRAHLEPSVTLERPKPELVAEDGKKLTKGEKKRRAAEKAERAANERVSAVEAFADAMLEIAPLNRGAKGSIRSGGTEGLALRKRFREWAKASQQYSHLHNVNDSHLGRAFNAVLDAGKDVRGSRYGAVMKQQRRAAA